MPNLVFLPKSRKKGFDVNEWRNSFDFSNVVVVSCRGEGREWVGGLAYLWNENVQVQVLPMSLKRIDMIVEMVAIDLEWKCMKIYGFAETHNKLHI